MTVFREQRYKQSRPPEKKGTLGGWSFNGIRGQLFNAPARLIPAPSSQRIQVVGSNCFDDNALHSHQHQKHRGWLRASLRGRQGSRLLWKFHFLNNVCVWFLGVPLSAKCTYRLLLMSTKGNGKKKLLHFPTLASAWRRQVGEIMTQRFFFFFVFVNGA